MIDERVKAAISMYAVLRNLQDLCELDPVAADLVRGHRIRVVFVVPGVGRTALTFDGGRCVASRDESAAGPPPPGIDDIVLGFVSASHFNALIDGKALPIPLRGARRLRFLQGPFGKLTSRLEALLRPAPGTVPDPATARTATVLTAYTAFYALSEVGNRDRLGRLNAARIPDGAVDVVVADGPTVHITATGGHLVTAIGPAPHARATMAFDSIETADGILSGRLDTYAAIGDGRMSVAGFIPMLDNMNKLLAQVSAYLA